MGDEEVKEMKKQGGRTHGRWRGQLGRRRGEGKTHGRWRGEGDEEVWGKNPWEMKRRGGKSMGDEKMKDEMWERERESEKKCRMIWTSVSAGIITWQCLEEKKKFISVLAFNLDYRL